MEEEQVTEFQKRVREKERQKLKAKRQGKSNVWQGFSVFGLIGWSVAMPTLIFGLIGLWLDERFPSSHSFTLALLVGGLVLGCVNAWYWVSRKIKEMEEEESEKKEPKVLPNNKSHD